MITCSCGKAIEKVPSWMQGIQVQFICNNCPERQAKNIARLAVEMEKIAAAKIIADLALAEAAEGLAVVADA